MRGVCLAAGVVLALALPSGAIGSVGPDASERGASAAGLSKNQRIALGALDARSDAVARIKAFVMNRPSIRALLRDRFECFDAATELSEVEIEALPDDLGLRVQLAGANYFVLHLYRLFPQQPRKGRYSAATIKKFFLGRAKKLNRLKPNLVGFRILRGLRAQADLINQFRAIPDFDICQILAQWRLGGYDTSFLASQLSTYGPQLLQIVFDNEALRRIDQAAAAMKQVPGIEDAEANEFTETLVNEPLELAIYGT